MSNENQQIVGAIKIKDGLFIGDEFASQDLEFVTNNKVMFVINAASLEIKNHFEKDGVQYYNLQWQENDQQILFDENDEAINKIVTFIDNSQLTGESCLVHSVRGQSRSCCVLAAYFMKKFKWTLYKTLEYLNSRRPDLEIRASFFYQLTALEAKLAKVQQSRTSSWNEQIYEKTESEDCLLRNTFLNARNQQIDEIYTNANVKNHFLNKTNKQKLKWTDQGAKGGLVDVVYNGPADQIISTSKVLNHGMTYRSILAGSKKVFTTKKPERTQSQYNNPISTMNTTPSTIINNPIDLKSIKTASINLTLNKNQNTKSTTNSNLPPKTNQVQINQNLTNNVYVKAGTKPLTNDNNNSEKHQRVMNNSDPVYTKENNKVEINDRKINNNLNSNAMQNNYGPFAYGNFNNDLGNFVNSTKTTPNQTLKPEDKNAIPAYQKLEQQFFGKTSSQNNTLQYQNGINTNQNINNSINQSQQSKYPQYINSNQNNSSSNNVTYNTATLNTSNNMFSTQQQQYQSSTNTIQIKAPINTSDSTRLINPTQINNGQVINNQNGYQPYLQFQSNYLTTTQQTKLQEYDKNYLKQLESKINANLNEKSVQPGSIIQQQQINKSNSLPKKVEVNQINDAQKRPSSADIEMKQQGKIPFKDDKSPNNRSISPLTNQSSFFTSKQNAGSLTTLQKTVSNQQGIKKNTKNTSSQDQIRRNGSVQIKNEKTEDQSPLNKKKVLQEKNDNHLYSQALNKKHNINLRSKLNNGEPPLPKGNQNSKENSEYLFSTVLHIDNQMKSMSEITQNLMKSFGNYVQQMDKDKSEKRLKNMPVKGQHTQKGPKLPERKSIGKESGIQQMRQRFHSNSPGNNNQTSMTTNDKLKLNKF